MEALGTSIPPKLFLGFLSASILLVLIYPWILAVIIISFVGGYFSILHFDAYSDKLKNIIQRLRGTVPDDDESTNKCTVPSVLPTDPLQQQLLLDNLAAQANCKVCPEKNCKRDELQHQQQQQKNNEKCSPARFQPKPFVLPKVDDLKIDPRLDASISRFCTTVFDFYVSSNWAPYETRKQLKLAFKKLFTILGERIKAKFILSEDESPEKFCREKLIPLLLYYLDKIKSHRGGSEGALDIFPESDQNRTKLKIRKLCRHVLEQSLNEDDQKCKLWMELCIAVLSDGVCWNLMMLGRDNIPELLEDYLKSVKFSETLVEQTHVTSKQEHQSQLKPQEEQEIESYDETDSRVQAQKNSCIPFLLDNFLDRKDSLEQPDPIVSRWRPTLKDIVDETELLYPLIQHLKHVGGQKALAYLQAVLDDSDAKEYCRRVLEVEYLPGFCRSHYFHESMGLSRVEQGLEVISDGSPSSSKKLKGHSRSASYGSRSNPAISDLLKIEGGVVEGLPLYYDPDYVSVAASINSSSSSSGYSSAAMGVTLPCAGTVETDSIFRKRLPLEDIVTKFISSTITLGTARGGKRKISESLSDGKEYAPRVGIDSKTYQEWDHPNVNTRVQIDGTKCDILESAVDILTSSISVNPWLGPVVSGWLRFLHPYLKPYFNAQLEEKLNEFLTLDLFITSVDLITDAFINSGEPDTPENIPLSKDNANLNSNSNQSRSSTAEESRNVNLSFRESQANIVKAFLKSFLDVFISKIISLDKFLSSFSTNRDYIFLFFVDVLDLLVSELFNCE